MRSRNYNFLSLSFLAFFINFSNIDAVRAQTLSARDLEQVRGAAVSSCFRTQRSSTLNNSLSDSVLINYCKCYAEAVFPSYLTVEEMGSAIRILRRSGNQAYIDFLLKGRDLYEISENCANRSLR
jgi:hypothetical protein